MRTSFGTTAKGACLLALGTMATALMSAATPALGAEVRSLPQFSGIWLSVESTHHMNTSAETMFEKATGPFSYPAGGPSLKPQYRQAVKAAIQKAEEAEARGELVTDSENQCFPDGMPKMMRGILPIEIVQTPKQVMVVTEELSQVRRIYLNEKMPPVEELSPSYNGYSVGHWEGDTLVIETRGIRSDVSFLYLPNSGNVKLTERMRLRTPDLLELKVTIDDPDVFEKPYSFTWTYNRDDSHKIMEYVCDNNRYAPGANGTQTLDVNIDR